MSLYRIQPQDIQITRGPRATFGEVTAAAFDYVQSGAVQTTSRQRFRSELEQPREEFLSGLMRGALMPEDAEGYEEPPISRELAVRLSNQRRVGGGELESFDLDEGTLEDLISELDQAGVEYPESLTPEGFEQRRADLAEPIIEEVERTQEVMSRGRGVSGALGQLVGSVAGEYDSVETLLSLPFGATGRAGIAATAAIEGSINAALIGASTPVRNQFLRELGLPEEDVLGSMLVGGILGAGLGGSIRGAQLHGPGMVRGMSRFLGVTAPRQSREALATLARSSEDDVARGAGEGFARDLEDEAAAVRNEMEPGAVDEHLQRAQDGALNVRDGVDAGTPDRPLVAQPGRSIIGGEIEEIAARDIALMPDTFQFKSELVGPGGQTRKLSDVTEWNPGQAGIVYAYEFADGTMAVADGHQRVNLARRIMDQDPEQDIRLASKVFREQDGWTTTQVRELAALKNIAEAADGMTVAMARDAARVLRTNPEALAQLPAGPGIQRAQRLSRLSDDAFQLYINEVVDERFAEQIGRMVDDPTMHAPMMRLIERTQPRTTEQAVSIIDQAMQAPVARERTTDLFGEREVAESLYLERARVLEEAMKQMRRDRSVFRTLTERQDRIEGAGRNRLDEATNKEIREETDRALVAVQKQAHRAGPISEALNDAATAVRDGENVAAAARRVAESVRNELGRSGIPGARAGDGGRAAEPTGAREPASDPNAGFAEPDGPAAADQTAATRGAIESPEETAASAAERVAERMTADQPRQIVRVADMRPAEASEVMQRLKARQPVSDIDSAMQAAERNHRALNDAMEEASRELGIPFQRAPVKDRARLEQKVQSKYQGDYTRVTDGARTGVTVRAMDEADAISAALSRRFHVVDEGWIVTDAGYFDRKMMVVFDDGALGEVQLWPPGMFAAKEQRGGHALYEVYRDQTRPQAERDQALADMEALYSEVAAGLDPSFAERLGIGMPRAERRSEAADGDSSIARSSPMMARPSSEDPPSGTQAVPDQRTARLDADTAPTSPASNVNRRMGDTSEQSISAGPGERNLEARLSDTGPGAMSDRVPVGIERTADGESVAVTRSRRELAEELRGDEDFVEQIELCIR